MIADDDELIVIGSQAILGAYAPLVVKLETLPKFEKIRTVLANASLVAKPESPTSASIVHDILKRLRDMISTFPCGDVPRSRATARSGKLAGKHAPVFKDDLRLSQD